MMKTQYITDKAGRKISVILPVGDYEKILLRLEELEDIEAWDEAMSSGEKAIPANQVFTERIPSL